MTPRNGLCLQELLTSSLLFLLSPAPLDFLSKLDFAFIYSFPSKAPCKEVEIMKEFKCCICTYTCTTEDWDEYVYRTQFTDEIENYKDMTASFIDLTNLKAGHYNSTFMCGRCVSELFFDNPEIFKKIERIIPP